MKQKPWRVAAGLFERAIELPPEERDAFVARQCGADALLRRSVEALLAAYDEPPPLFEPGAHAAAAARPGAVEPGGPHPHVPTPAAARRQAEQSIKAHARQAMTAARRGAVVPQRRGLPGSH